MTFKWSKKPFILGLLYSSVVCVFAWFLKNYWIFPWEPIGVIGIAVAFYLGFKNNSSYDRLWEARKIWGSVVNNSRSFAATIIAFIDGENAPALHKELIYRHLAWLTAFRYQLRHEQPWEHEDNRVKDEYAPGFTKEFDKSMDEELRKFMSDEEVQHIKQYANPAAQILKQQSVRLKQMTMSDFDHVEVQQIINELYADQGMAERIKNFPFPRQYASTALWLTLVFCALVPFGMMDIFRSLGEWSFWICPIFSALIIWVFLLMEKVGDYSENPFESAYNDVPLMSIARGIEIDLRQMIDDEDVPGPVKDENGFLL